MKKFLSLALVAIMVFALALPCLAITPSVEQKPAPEIVPPKVSIDVDPENPDAPAPEIPSTVVAVLDHKDKGEKKDYVHYNQITVTSLADALYQPSDDPAQPEAPAVDEEAKQLLQEAHEDLTKHEIKDLVKDIEKAVKETTKKEDIKPEKIVVRDVFDVKVDEEIMNALEEDEDQFLTMTFNVDASQIAGVIYRCPGDEGWSHIDPKDVIKNDDGTLTVNFSRLCPVAFLTLAEDEAEEPTEEPVESSNSWIIILVVALAVVVVVIVVVVVVLKKRGAKTEEKTEDDAQA